MRYLILLLTLCSFTYAAEPAKKDELKKPIAPEASRFTSNQKTCQSSAILFEIQLREYALASKIEAYNKYSNFFSAIAQTHGASNTGSKEQSQNKSKCVRNNCTMRTYYDCASINSDFPNRKAKKMKQDFIARYLEEYKNEPPKTIRTYPYVNCKYRTTQQQHFGSWRCSLSQ